MGYRDARLWKRLEELTGNKDGYLTAAAQICDFAVSRAKMVNLTFPNYTLHDETHICNVLHWMAELLGARIGDLSRDEAALLVLCACCHDLGMSYTDEERAEALADENRLNDYFRTHIGDENEAYRNGKGARVLTPEIEQNYLRSIHHERARDILTYRLILGNHPQPVDWPLDGNVSCEAVARVCRSHGEPIQSLRDLNGKAGFDLRLCAVLLRLADGLDFDKSRAPAALYDFYGFARRADSASRYSRGEWDKHLSSGGFSYPAEREAGFELDYSAVCKSPEAEQGVRAYVDWMERDLRDCGSLLRAFRGRWHDLALPEHINCAIESKGYVSGAYRLTLDAEHVLKLFTGEKLYGEPTVFVRELIQNAIDAVRTREKLDKFWDAENSQIVLRSWEDDEGYRWFSAEDNGTGMTKEIIENYLLKVGRSYYESDEFRREKRRCGAEDFTPISRFGIGILSCFSGEARVDRVEISTRHYGEGADSLRLTMRGLNGFYYLRSKNAGHPANDRSANDRAALAYRSEAGTVVAVRIDPYRHGNFYGFREIVEKYVFCPPVPVRYDGADGMLDFMTEKAYLEELHKHVSPGKTLLEEFPLTDDVVKKMKHSLPQIDYSCLPNIQLHCFALNQYTESPYLNGILLCARLTHPIYYYQQNGKSAQLVPAVCKFDFSKTTIQLDIGIKYDASPPKKITTFRFGIYSNPLLTSIDPFLRKFYGGFYNRIDIYHNGIRCGKSASTGSDLGDSVICCKLFLRDKYRPEVNTARNQIDCLPPEAALDLGAAAFRLSRQTMLVSGVGLRLGYDRSLIDSQYRDILTHRDDLLRHMTFDTERGWLSAEELRETLRVNPTLRLGRWVHCPAMDYHIGSYDSLRLSYLQNVFTLYHDFASERATYLRTKDLAHSPDFSRFPPVFFMFPLNADCHFLTARFCKRRVSCNADHRLSRFLLRNAENLQEIAPGVLDSFLRSLARLNYSHLIDDVNRNLDKLRALPNNPFNVTDDLMLTSDDLYD